MVLRALDLPRQALDGPGGAYPGGPEWPGPVRPALRPGRVYGVSPAADVDRDGVPDLIASIDFDEFPAEVNRRLPKTSPRDLSNTPSLSRRVVVAVSGRSGKWLWSHAVDPKFTTNPQQSWDRPASVVSGRKRSTVAMSNGAAWLGLDPQTGRPLSGPIDLGFKPLRPVQYADLDDDGEPTSSPSDQARPPRTERSPRSRSRPRGRSGVRRSTRSFPRIRRSRPPGRW